MRSLGLIAPTRDWYAASSPALDAKPQEGGCVMKEGDKFACLTLPNHRIRLSIVRDGKSADLDLDSKDASAAAAQILESARDAFLQSGKSKPPQESGKQEPQWQAAYPTSIGLGPSQRQEHESLLFQFGDAILAIPVEKSQLRRLGEALIALSDQTARLH
jgi:hypothetical protein